MLNIGCHLSSSKGFKHMGKEALSISANTFQFFSRNPRGSKAKAVNEKDTAALNEILKEKRINSEKNIGLKINENDHIINNSNIANSNISRY